MPFFYFAKILAIVPLKKHTTAPTIDSTPPAIAPAPRTKFSLMRSYNCCS